MKETETLFKNIKLPSSVSGSVEEEGKLRERLSCIWLSKANAPTVYLGRRILCVCVCGRSV